MNPVGQIDFSEQIEDGEPEFKQLDNFKSVIVLTGYGKPVELYDTQIELMQYTGKLS